MEGKRDGSLKYKWTRVRTSMVKKRGHTHTHTPNYGETKSYMCTVG